MSSAVGRERGQSRSALSSIELRSRSGNSHRRVGGFFLSRVARTRPRVASGSSLRDSLIDLPRALSDSETTSAVGLSRSPPPRLTDGKPSRDSPSANRLVANLASTDVEEQHLANDRATNVAGGTLFLALSSMLPSRRRDRRSESVAVDDAAIRAERVFACLPRPPRPPSPPPPPRRSRGLDSVETSRCRHRCPHPKDCQ